MRRYISHLLILCLILVLASFGLMYFSPSHFIVAMPLMVVYFAAVTGAEHYLVVKALHKDARTFIKTFLGLTVAKLLLHLVVLAAFMFANPQQARLFAIAFAVCYIATLAFETIALSRYVRQYQKKNSPQQDET